MRKNNLKLKGDTFLQYKRHYRTCSVGPLTVLTYWRVLRAHIHPKRPLYTSAARTSVKHVPAVEKLPALQFMLLIGLPYLYIKPCRTTAALAVQQFIFTLPIVLGEARVTLLEPQSRFGDKPLKI